MDEGKFALVYINKKGVVFPAYPKELEGREMVDNLVQAGMFGQEILVDKKTPLGMLKAKLGDYNA